MGQNALPVSHRPLLMASSFPRCFLALCMGLMFCSQSSAQRVPPWQALSDEAIALFQLGKYEQSIEVAKKGLEMVERVQNAEHPGAALFLNRIDRKSVV